ncbi:MAG: hypothetical protein ACK5LY_10120 [Lachnospirales bacterium]
MIKFRNPSTSPITQVQIFKELFNEYSEMSSFDLADMVRVMTKEKLMTAYGYSGNAAISLSTTKNKSLNSVEMNAKMTAEVFRLLGWVSSIGNNAYPVTFTLLGEYIAKTEDILPLYEQCVLGINNPQEIMNVKYDENVRFSTCILFSLINLNGVMYKHELCLGPMSVNDIDTVKLQEMVTYLKSLRGYYQDLDNAFNKLCKDLNMKSTSVDNMTRLPIALLKTCGWIESTQSNKDIYSPKALKCLKITPKGKDLFKLYCKCKDLRLSEFNTYSEDIQDALIRLGMYSMLESSGYDMTPVLDSINSDTQLCFHITGGKKLLFSPYQTIKKERVDKAFGFNSTKNENSKISMPIIPSLKREKNNITDVVLNNIVNNTMMNCNEVHDKIFIKKLISLKKLNLSNDEIITKLFNEFESYNQKDFYPLIETLFKIMGMNCKYSRAGDNGARWDAIILDEKRSIPIEIKSPTEEKYISIKAVKQALENKIILLSRKTHITDYETTSLVVGYNIPNDRAEVSDMIQSFKDVYGYRIGIIGLEALLKCVVHIILDNKSINIENINKLEGIINVITE